MSDLKLPLDLFRNVVIRHGSAPALAFEGRQTSYAELDRRSNQCANALIEAGIKPGERVCVMARNSDEFFILFFGAMKARVCLTPINWRLAAPEVAFVLNDSGAKLVVHSAEFADTIEAAAKECAAGLRRILFDGAPGEDFAHWMSAHSDKAPAQAIAPGDDLIQLYTSGTTGFPKGVQLSHENYRVFIEAVIAAGWAKWDAGKSSLVASPLFHVAGVNVGLISLLQ